MDLFPISNQLPQAGFLGLLCVCADFLYSKVWHLRFCVELLVTKDLLENVWYIHHQTFISQQNLNVTGRPIGKYVPSQGPVSKTYTDNAMIVGDAAGHVIAVNGGGIPIAMVCGRIAGIVAAEHVSSGVPLSKYEEEWRKQVYKPLHTAVKVNHLAQFFFKGPMRLEFSMKVLGARRMGKILRCRSPFP